MTTEEFIEKAKEHLKKNRGGTYDIISAGVCPWEDVHEGGIIAITIKIRGRLNYYEVWEYARLIEDMEEFEFVFARVATTGEKDSLDYERDKWVK